MKPTSKNEHDEFYGVPWRPNGDRYRRGANKKRRQENRRIIDEDLITASLMNSSGYFTE